LLRNIIPFALAILVTQAVAAEPVTAGHLTLCSAGKSCFCVASGMEDAIAQRVASIRETVRAQKQQGKLIAYLSVPISGTGGGYFPINVQVAQQEKERIEQQLGAQSSWVLNPASTVFSLPSGASGADYMAMWAQVLEGETGLGEDFDAFYFAGPAAYKHYFSLTGSNDAGRLADYYDSHAANDASLRKIARLDFIRYYGVRASVSFSSGSHDEWNIARGINERRRASKDYGISRQLAVLFNGEAVAPSLFESAVAPGNAGECR